jgi:putative oxygen-independent coproporphyrinogen III oxidase
MHLYIHVPFCARRCSYCDFAIAVRREVPSDRFVDRILQEWAGWRRGPLLPGDATLATIYLGGGTPSRLAPDALARLLGSIGSDHPLRTRAEVTLEANPEDVTPAAAAAWRRAGITRVSLGVQSFDPEVLAWMHRTHTAEQVPGAVKAIRQAGIADLTLDLIYALPPELHRDWETDLDRALALEPDHLSLYGLTVEPRTPLARWIGRGAAQPAPEDRYADEFLGAHARLTRAGFEHYEVSNYALPGHRASHNSAYWRRAPFIGLGPSAHSGWNSTRQWNIAEWSAWDRALEAGGSAVAGRESVTPDQQRLEALYLGLRTSAGVEARLVPPALMDGWVAAGWAVRDGASVRLLPEGWLRLDALVAVAA